ncbi:unannotated protein [freshwater metagenome]|uniref:Unannotated protein n=1 Tax=freshwater metagenome TaxID=449393 RepID=A0A6J6DH39_9ZZZZ|nr:hypothetical protein [Actinomycetota bacterium]
MTLPLPLSLILRLLGVVFLGLLAFYAINESSHWLVMVSLSCLATLAVMRRANLLLYWPIGLLTVMTAMFGGYWWQWLSNPVGVDLDSSRTLFGVLTVLFAVVAALRMVWHRDVVVLPHAARILTVVIMSTLPVVLIYLVTSRWGDEPVRLIAGHLAGGDHGAHNEIVHRLLKASENVFYEKPLQLYAYPQAIHFMIANLIAFTQSTSTLPLLAQEYVMGAWVEWVQFAAFCQLSIVVFMKGVRGTGLRRALFLPPLMFVFASMDSFVMHLLWSGFTTSLGITWILLAFLAVSDRMHFKDSLRQSWSGFVALGFFAYASWFVYQPYAVIFVAIAGLFFVQLVTSHHRLSQAMGRVSVVLAQPVVLVLTVTVGVFVALIGVLGSDSPAVRSLLLDGATYKPYFYTVMLWAFAAMAGQWLATRESELPGADVVQLKFLFTLFGFVAGMILTVMWAGGFGLLDQPYYTQKMLWVLLFVSLPVALSVGCTWLDKVEFSWPAEKRRGAIAVLAVALLLTPLVQGRAPVNGAKQPNVKWFAQGMTLDIPEGEYRAVAFAWMKPLESHVSNLALRATTELVMPINVALSNNTYFACRFINENEATVVYTSTHGYSALVNSGCNTNAIYIEEDRIMEKLKPSFPSLTVGNERFVTDGAIGAGHILRGFLPMEDWGVWAGGYQSVFGVRTREATPNAVLRVKFETHMVYGRGIGVTLRVNGEVSNAFSMPRSGELIVDVALGDTEARQQFEVSIECERTDEQVLKDDPFDGPIPCVGLKSFVLTNGPS